MVLEDNFEKDETLIFADDSFIDKADLKFFYSKFKLYN